MSRFIFLDLQVDLADFQQLAKENDGYRYLLVGVDVMSRRLFTAPVKAKTSVEMKKAFEQIFQQMPNLPSFIYSDLGLEFTSKEMKEYFKEKGIKQQTTRTGETKAAFAEGKIKVIKERLYRWFSEKNSTRWLETVPKIVKALNNKPNTTTGIAPNKFTPEMTREVWDRLYKDHMIIGERKNGGINFNKPRYEEGDAVRLAKAKRTFDKG